MHIVLFSFSFTHPYYEYSFFKRGFCSSESKVKNTACVTIWRKLNIGFSLFISLQFSSTELWKTLRSPAVIPVILNVPSLWTVLQLWSDLPHQTILHVEAMSFEKQRWENWWLDFLSLCFFMLSYEVLFCLKKRISKLFILLHKYCWFGDLFAEFISSFGDRFDSTLIPGSSLFLYGFNLQSKWSVV